MSIEIRSCHPDELERLLPLLNQEFIYGKGREVSLRKRFPTTFCRDNLHNIMVCTQAEVIVSALAIRQFDWREHDVIYRGAMIGAVYTAPTRRGEGLATRLLTAATIRLRETEVDFGVLWTGRQSFYARLGWLATDCGVFTEVEPNALMPKQSGCATRLPAKACAPQLEHMRQRWLKVTTVRRAVDYRQLPPPAASVDVLICENQRTSAYALLGSSGETGFLYELTGDPDCFTPLWQEACRGRQRIFVNDQAGSPSCRWLADHVGISWKDRNLAMWLPVSKRVDIRRLGQWNIPYFDRI